MTERQISDGLCAFLRKNKLLFIRARTDKKSGIALGWPDVTVVHCGRAWVCELKTRTGKLSIEQKELIADLRQSGTPVTVARSVEEAVNALNEWMGVVGVPGQENSLQQPPEREKRLPEGWWECRCRTLISGAQDECPNCGLTKQRFKEILAKNTSQNQFIGNMAGRDWVFEGTGIAGSSAKPIRPATMFDTHLPRV